MRSQYTSVYYSGQSDGSLKGARTMLPFVFELVRPRSVIDVGCGVGTWLRAARELGVEDVTGLDGSYVDRSKLQVPFDRFFPTDLSKPFQLNRRFDLAMTLEVAEHLPPSSASGFVESLTKLSDVILFSAAIPLQRGVQHINEQWPDYWANLFTQHGFFCCDLLRHRFWNAQEVPCCYRQNSLIFATQLLIERNGWQSSNPLPLVHPDLWLQVNESEERLRTIAGMANEIPRTLGRPVRRLLRRVSGQKN